MKDDKTVLAYAPKESFNYRTSLHGLTQSVHKFNFSHVFPETTTQAQFFKATTFPVVKEFVEGQNCLVFTYGVTNSGKTFTVLGRCILCYYSRLKLLLCSLNIDVM